ncbi:MAG: redox-regulated ATPase YchF [Actinobacteria bacterium]|nr:redox-regulated ATPase YchF [Actinomycetota bacterium]
MSLSIGIVGLPNVGKSTLFTALTRKAVVAANYPFATIDPNVGVVPVPDGRLDRLARIVLPQRVLPAAVEFVDIAGLVRGAHQGEGLGNQFLSHIRETDALCEVIRYFADPNVVHVDGRIDPVSDAESIRTELVLADLATAEKVLVRLEKDIKRDKGLAEKFTLVKRVAEWLAQGHRARKMEMSDLEREMLADLHLLTMKPMLYLANVDESALDGDPGVIDGITPIVICGKIEADLAELSREDASEYMAAIGLEEAGLNRVIREAYRLLGLQSFFTAGEKEVRAWAIPIGAKAPQAAGAIHSDFERGFIKAEVIAYDDYIALGGEKQAREAGKLRIEGKDYVMADGDVVHFRFNV